MTEPTEPIEPTEPTEPIERTGPGRLSDEIAPATPRRRLDQAPGERFAAGSGPASVALAEVGSPARAVAMGAVGAGVGVVAFLVLAIGFTFTAGLVVVAIFIGRFAGLFVRAGAGRSLSSAARVVVAVLVFLVAMSVAILATWLWSHVEGGDLPLPDYLDQAYGTPLIALEFMVGTLTAWWSAR